VNWLNTSTGHQAAYQLTGVTELTLWAAGDAWDNDPGAGVDLNLYRHKDAYYFLPSEDEWYKAAYHQNDGVTANYWDYGTGSNSIPTAVASGTGAGTAVYTGQADPADVNLAGGLSPYGTMGQNGNAWEWHESAFDGSNNSSSELRAFRGGVWDFTEIGLRSSFRVSFDPTGSINSVGFRVASVPEPSAAMLMLGPGLMWLVRRRRAKSSPGLQPAALSQRGKARSPSVGERCGLASRSRGALAPKRTKQGARAPRLLERAGTLDDAFADPDMETLRQKMNEFILAARC
jgi:formylglycine-generating enzyme